MFEPAAVFLNDVAILMARIVGLPSQHRCNQSMPLNKRICRARGRGATLPDSASQSAK